MINLDGQGKGSIANDIKNHCISKKLPWTASPSINGNVTIRKIDFNNYNPDYKRVNSIVLSDGRDLRVCLSAVTGNIKEFFNGRDYTFEREGNSLFYKKELTDLEKVYAEIKKMDNFFTAKKK